MDDYQLDVLFHELKNPLTAIKVLAKLLHKKLGEGDPNQGLVQSMLAECDRLEAMLRTPPRQGSHPYDLGDFLQSQQRLYEALVASYHQTLIWNTSGIPKGICPQISAFHLRQVLDNLILNACKFSTAGSTVKVTVKVNGAADPQTVLLEVTDSGSGIPPEAMAQIFVPYQRLHPDQPGQGLGLAIVKDLVEKSNGKIEVNSQPGQGSRFRVYLPFLNAPAHDAAHDLMNTPAHNLINSQSPSSAYEPTPSDFIGG